MHCATNNSNKTQGRTITFPFRTDYVKTVIVSPYFFIYIAWWQELLVVVIQCTNFTSPFTFQIRYANNL